jgi:cytochrome d ubiquinol oxidase subunit II
LVPTLVFSLAAGNLIIGLPFQFDNDLRSSFSGGFLDLFQPFALLSVVVGVAMLCLHGAVFLHWRTEAALAERARQVITYSAVLFVVSFIVAGIWVAVGLDGYRITSTIDTSIVNKLLAKIVAKESGLWLANYSVYPWLKLAPLLAIAGTGLVVFLTAKRLTGWAFITSSIVVISVIMTAAGSMFPFIMPSSISPTSSLTVWDSSASPYTLKLLFFATVLMMPMVMAYTTWVYRVMRGKVTVEDIQKNKNVLY